MCGNWPAADLPRLTVGAYTPSSPCTRRYNCIAWAADDTTGKWWPDPLGIGKWPAGVPREATVDAFIRAYGTLGYALCQDNSLEAGFEKIAIYATRETDGSLSPTHAAKQLPNGHWSSKLGDFEDIEHPELDVLDGPAYGTSVCFLKRPR
jgi:hypothetical protein